MKTKCLIVDDEPLAIKVIASYIDKIPSLVLSGSCHSAIEAMNKLLEQKVDLVFLDVEMPELSGIEMVRSLKNPPFIIFTTAYRNFALDAFELEAVDYLLKPISFERFFKAVNRYYQFLKNVPTALRAKEESTVTAKPYLYVRADRKVLKILFEDIRYVESLKDYVKIYLADEVIVAKEKISTLENELPSNQFLRVHRSFIVSLAWIKAFNNEMIEINKMQIPIGRTYKNAVLNFLGFK